MNWLRSKNDFFNHPDVLYICPGIKDEVTVRDELGNKTKLRKTYLTMFLKEAYELFKSSNPGVTIGFSTFCKMRPKNVLLLHETPADLCKCVTCENFFLKLSSLKLPYDQFWPKHLCDSSLNSKCCIGNCNNCSFGQRLPQLNEDEKLVKTYLKEWVKVDNRPLCRTEEFSKEEILEKLKNTFNIVSKHINLNRIQANNFEDKKNKNVRILQMDLAMNYSCEYQREVQSAQWTQGSVTLFTAAVIHNEKCNTFVVCSDTQVKEKKYNSLFY